MAEQTDEHPNVLTPLQRARLRLALAEGLAKVVSDANEADLDNLVAAVEWWLYADELGAEPVSPSRREPSVGG